MQPGLSKNIPEWERNVRIIAGAVLVAVGAVLEYIRFRNGPDSFPGLPLMLLGLIPIITAAFGFCPIRRALGLGRNVGQAPKQSAVPSAEEKK